MADFVQNLADTMGSGSSALQTTSDVLRDPGQIPIVQMGEQFQNDPSSMFVPKAMQSGSSQQQKEAWDPVQCNLHKQRCEGLRQSGLDSQYQECMQIYAARCSADQK